MLGGEKGRSGVVNECKGGSPNVPKTTKGKVFPMIHSPIAPRIMRRPPKKKKTPTRCYEKVFVSWHENRVMAHRLKRLHCRQLRASPSDRRKGGSGSGEIRPELWMRLD